MIYVDLGGLARYSPQWCALLDKGLLDEMRIPPPPLCGEAPRCPNLATHSGVCEVHYSGAICEDCGHAWDTDEPECPQCGGLPEHDEPPMGEA